VDWADGRATVFHFHFYRFFFLSSAERFLSVAFRVEGAYHLVNGSEQDRRTTPFRWL
jgi:hypothetical protein